MKQIYYIQKEEFQLGETTVYAPDFYEDYDMAKEDFEALIKLEKEDMNYIDKETEGVDFVGLKGSDKWGQVQKIIYLRSNNLNKKLIYINNGNI
ncbi:hypothetical protein [Paraclostridium bifermentans]|uniref:hypothetical protein n=1 Tax=Paraclostridium bifermentans TaxID=1490 RepID=UPI00189B2B7E|nr:hypothetical protein [Paraclostridium bifermentans]